MMLGKRRRQSMKRTTSIAEFTPDLKTPEESAIPSDQNTPAIVAVNRNQQVQNLGVRHPFGPVDLFAECKLSNSTIPMASGPMISPQEICMNSGDFSIIAPFLRSCGLCMRRLNPGRDIFIYRGEIAFCSLECRQQLMNQDERKEKCSFSSMKTHSAPANSTSSETSGAGEEVVAA